MNKTGKLFTWAACLMPTMICAESPSAQPVPFSRKTHVVAGLTCIACHTIAPPGDLAGFPTGSFCMGCHSNIKSDSPGIQALAGFVRDQKRISWVRIYKLPQFVYFSHQVHYKDAGIECAECHGPVSERNVLMKEKSTTMADCMNCHDQRKAPNGCDVCHDSH